MSRKHYLVALALVAIVAAAWYFIPASKSSSNDVASDTPNLGAEAPLSVQVRYARQGTLVVRLSATGYTKAIRQVPLTAQVAGVIDSLPVYEGKPVRKNDLLLKIQEADYRLAVNEAQEQLDQATIIYGQQRAERSGAAIRIDTLQGYYLNPRHAEAALKQAQQDCESGGITPEELFLFKSEYQASRLFEEESKRRLIALRTGLTKAAIGLQRAELNLQRTRLLAPFSGVAANLKVAAGQPIAVGAECLTLVDLDTMLLEVDILETDAPRVQTGRQATAQFAAFPNENFSGQVIAVNPLVDAEKRVRRTVVAIPNRSHRLIPGLYAQVKIEAQHLENRLIVPKEAIVLRDQRRVVFIVRSEKESGLSSPLAKWCYVEIGAENEEEVEVVSSAFNLQSGEPVIVTNHFTMAHDTPVRIE